MRSTGVCAAPTAWQAVHAHAMHYLQVQRALEPSAVPPCYMERNVPSMQEDFALLVGVLQTRQDLICSMAFRAAPAHPQQLRSTGRYRLWHR